MQTKSVLYAAVGAPVVAARKVGDRFGVIKDRVGEEKATRSKAAEAAIESWAAEGEKVITRVSEGKVVEEISSKVDLDQAKEQVSKLRDQLEDMLATWRTSFRPEKANGKSDVKEGEKEGEKTPSTKKPATAKTASKPAAKTPTAKTTKSSTAAKTSSTETEKAS
ncbi:MAG: hypothetical protein V3S32_00905 [Acidimicrobiia bacterium]